MAGRVLLIRYDGPSFAGHALFKDTSNRWEFTAYDFRGSLHHSVLLLLLEALPYQRMIGNTLQTLGMPLSLSFLSGLTSGLTAIFILPCVSWLADRGSNPQRRKIATIVLAAGLLFGGLLCLLAANFLHIQYLLNYDAHTNTLPNASFVESTSVRSRPDADFVVSSPGILSDITGLRKETYNHPGFEMTEGMKSTMNTSSSGNNDDSSVPFKAGLAMFGFILMDIGFDASNCFVRAFLVSCSPRSEHTSLLVTGLVMASGGGVFTAALGLVDFTSLLDLGYIEGANLMIQTSVQAVGVTVMVTIGLLITLITGYRHLQHMREQNTNTDTHAYNNDLGPKPDEVLTGNTMADAFENSIRSFAGIYFEPHTTVAEDSYSSNAEEAPLLPEEEESSTCEEIGGAYLLSASMSYGTVEPALVSQDRMNLTIKEEEEEEGYQEKEHPRQSGCIQNPKIKIVFICLSVLFTTSFTMMMTFCISDFIGKVIYEGDPNGVPGSDSVSRYQQGMKMASWAFLVYFITYLVASIAHSRILALLGYRVEYVLVHVLMVVAMLTAAMTARLEAVFVLTVIAGMHRACYFSVPFAVTNDIAQSMEKSGEGRSPVGMAMSFVSASIPLSYCLLYSWVGAVESYTDDPAVPLYLGSGYGCIAFITFLCVGKV